MKAAAVLLALAACGDNQVPPAPDAPAPFADVAAQLAAIPGVTVTPASTTHPGYGYFVLHFTQPVDHDDPASATFQQEVSLLVRDPAAPLVVHTSGYWDYYKDNRVELTRMLAANQISIEHRFFGDSRPSPADWTKLTIAQMAADEHAIIAALHPIFHGAFLTTGGSKGGMTAVYHRRFYPDDVAGTVPYVAPQSFGAPDTRYDAQFATIGPPACRAAVQAVATELLAHRRDAITALAAGQAGHAYTRVSLAAAVEGAIAALEWSFWQYHGVTECAQVPAPTADDATLFAFLDAVSPVTDSDDASLAQFEPYYYQAYAQLGYPDTYVPYLAANLQFHDADYAGALPNGVEPAYDGGTAMHDVDAWLRASGAHFQFVYGQWDPWIGGAFTLGNATDAAIGVVAEGTHDSAQLATLAAADRDAALARLQAWTGVTPVLPTARFEAPAEPRVPPALLRALRAIPAR